MLIIIILKTTSKPVRNAQSTKTKFILLAEEKKKASKQTNKQ